MLESDGANVATAVAVGAVGIVDATWESVLRRRGIEYASTVVVSIDRDDTAVLVTLTSSGSRSPSASPQ